MAERILRISFEGTYGFLHETAKRTIDIFKYTNGEYYYKFSRLNESLDKITTKRKMDANKINEIITMLSEIQIPAFPIHEMGCDGGFTEIEVGDYAGKSHFRWWSCPPIGWEKLDEITQRIIDDIENV